MTKPDGHDVAARALAQGERGAGGRDKSPLQNHSLANGDAIDQTQSQEAKTGPAAEPTQATWRSVRR